MLLSILHLTFPDKMCGVQIGCDKIIGTEPGHTDFVAVERATTNHLEREHPRSQWYDSGGMLVLFFFQNKPWSLPHESKGSKILWIGIPGAIDM